MLYINLIGALGLLLVLVAFFLENAGKLNRKDIRYDSLNFVGAGILVFYAFALKAWIFVALNIIWAIVALKDIIFKDLKHLKP